jgi:hypothetical protein
LVTHYSTLAGYPKERGGRHDAAERLGLRSEQYTGGYLYVDARKPELEDVYTRGRSL